MKSDFLRLVQSRRRVVEKESAILEICTGRRVLDVGCVGQARAVDSPKWLHGKIAGVARETIGVDIDTEGAKRLNEKGFQIVHPDELDSADRFDVVVMGDVIEHVSDLVTFLDYYQAFMSDDGIMVITTPNAFSLLQVFNVLLNNSPAVNEEHTVWLEPHTMAEVVARTNLKIVDFEWIREEYEIAALPRKSRVLHRLAHVVREVRPYTSPNFMCVLGKA